MERVRRGVPKPLGYCAFVLLIVLATMPVWRLIVFGMTADDRLQLRCF